MSADADEVWNRACDPDAPFTHPGDAALAAVLLCHGTAMNGGLLHACETLDPDQRARAVAGYRLLGLDAPLTPSRTSPGRPPRWTATTPRPPSGWRSRRTVATTPRCRSGTRRSTGRSGTTSAVPRRPTRPSGAERRPYCAVTAGRARSRRGSGGRGPSYRRDR